VPATSTLVAHLADAFEGARDGERAVAMAAYMRDQFPFLGIPTPERRRLLRAVVHDTGRPDASTALNQASALWRRREREFQYAACDLLARCEKQLDGGALPVLERLITTKSWWDTVDALAGGVVGPVVQRDRSLDRAIDEWFDSGNLWLRRTALLHQLHWKAATDADRLFGFCERAASDRDFFIRKAIGWALRQYAYADPGAVLRFVKRHDGELSTLSKREALKHLSGS
jgi:3-methyladenine DNA glycosylase AlkD